MNPAVAREALADFLAGLPKVQTYARWPDQPVLLTGGATIIVKPASGDYDGLEAGKHTMLLHVGVGLGVKLEEAQDRLDTYLATSGANSIFARIASDRTLGAKVTQAFPRGYRDYETVKWGTVEVLEAVIEVEVWEV